jgi:hypothetical protein
MANIKGRSRPALSLTAVRLAVATTWQAGSCHPEVLVGLNRVVVRDSTTSPKKHVPRRLSDRSTAPVASGQREAPIPYCRTFTFEGQPRHQAAGPHPVHGGAGRRGPTRARALLQGLASRKPHEGNPKSPTPREI